MNVNSITISQLPGKIIRSDNSNSVNKSMFENMLNNAMAENQNMMALFGNNFGSIPAANGIEIEDYSIELENNDETKNHNCFENIYGIADIFLFRPNAAIEEVIAENKTTDVDYNFIDAKLKNGTDITAGSALQEKQESVFAFQDNTAKSLMSEIEIQRDLRISNDTENSNEAQNMKTIIELGKKQKNESVYLEIPANDIDLKNKIITISDGSTEIKSQVLSQVKDKIIIMTENSQDSNGIKTITMELRPQSLGKVDIKMSYENNKLTVEIKASNEETQKILSSNTDELKELLGKTSQTDVKIIVKPNEPKNQNIINYQDNRQGSENFYQDNEQNNQGRQRSKYYYDNDIKTKEEDIFSELIDFNYSRIKEGMNGN